MRATGAHLYGIILSGLGRVNRNAPSIYIPKSYLDRSILTTWTLVFSHLQERNQAAENVSDHLEGEFLTIMRIMRQS